MIGLEALGGKYLSMTGVKQFTGLTEDFIYGSITLAEEAVEMIGLVLFFRAPLVYLGMTSPGFVITLGPDPASPTTPRN